MKSKIRKSVMPFSVAVAVALLFLVTIFSIVSSNITKADDGKPVMNVKSTGHMLTIHDKNTEKVILTNKSTIGEALIEAGINVDSKDVVEPAINEKLIATDYQVNIYRARPVVIVDGNLRTKITTAYQTARQIVESAGITLYDEDTTTLQSTTDVISDGVGLQVTINRSIPINLTLYGKVATVRTMEKTVGQMLFKKGVILKIDDIVQPDINTPLSANMVVKVWREGKQIISVDEPVDFEVDKIEDTDREVGYSEIKIAGEKGLRSASYEVTIQDGVEVSRVEIASIIITAAKKQTEVVGVKGKYTTPSENETITWNYLIEKGFSRIQTAGIMGNIMQEHRFSTTDADGGFGIIQWTGGRRQAIMAIPNSDNIYVQLDFLMSELNGGYYGVRDAIKSSDSLISVVQIFQNQFERCGLCREDLRIRYAQDILASH